VIIRKRQVEVNTPRMRDLPSLNYNKNGFEYEEQHALSGVIIQQNDLQLSRPVIVFFLFYFD